MSNPFWHPRPGDVMSQSAESISVLLSEIVGCPNCLSQTSVDSYPGEGSTLRPFAITVRLCDEHSRTRSEKGW
jgi:hypothetical protein